MTAVTDENDAEELAETLAEWATEELMGAKEMIDRLDDILRKRLFNPETIAQAITMAADEFRFAEAMRSARWAALACREAADL